MIRSVQDLEVIERSGTLSAETLSIELTESLRLLPGRREVFRGRLVEPETEIVIKCYWPHPKQARDWRREWDGLIELLKLQLPAPAPLAVCRGVDGEVYVIMRRIEGADTLGRYLNAADIECQREIMFRLAQLVATLHRAGARQLDQHVDNWAVAAQRLYLLDAGTYQFSGKPLSFAARLADLAAICVTLPPAAERTFRAALDELYWLESSARTKLISVDLEGAIISQQVQRARRYYKKTQRNCTEFGQRNNEKWRGMFAHVADSQLIEDFFADPDAFMQQGERLKDGNTCTVQTFRYADRAYVLKRYNKKPWLTRLRRALVASRAQKSWSNGWLLKLAFIPTAEPVAYLEERSFPCGRSYLLMHAIDGCLLSEFVQAHGQDTARFDAVVQGVGQIWAALGRLRASHGDLKASNWMVDANEELFLFDLDSFCFALSERVFKRGREKDRKRFLKNWKTQPQRAQAFRARMEHRSVAQASLPVSTSPASDTAVENEGRP